MAIAYAIPDSYADFARAQNGMFWFVIKLPKESGSKIIAKVKSGALEIATANASTNLALYLLRPSLAVVNSPVD